jgi:diguanylate cyclase (GGDEF)-like protein
VRHAVGIQDGWFGPSRELVVTLVVRVDEVENENDAYRLRRTTTPQVMSMDLVAAIAGDREMTEADVEQIQVQTEARGRVFSSDLLYAISHHYFAPEVAETLWERILTHKHLLSERLNRNVRIAVATLDYLSNITAELRSLTLISEAYVAEIAGLAMRDGMTGLFNHSTAYELLELELRNHERYGLCVSILLLDIDDFKLVNDRKGHQAGDRLLVEVAKTLTSEARDSDSCCRLGGDEFVVILRLTYDSGEAYDIAERIRARIASIPFDAQRISVSVGVAVSGHATTTTGALIERADRALHQAKTDGKNQVVLGAVD